MCKHYVVVFIVALAIGLANAQDGFRNSLSPNIQRFLEDHPDGSKTLTNVLAEACSNRPVRLYYFYTDNQATPKVVHFYPDWGIFLTVEADQEPLDEFYCIIFGLLDTENDAKCEELVRSARSGTISKSDFALEMVRQQFKTFGRTRDLIRRIKFNKKETLSSHYYKIMVDMPDDFDQFLKYQKTVSKVDWKMEYEKKFDRLRAEAPPHGDPP